MGCVNQKSDNQKHIGPKTIDNNNSENRILNTEHSNHLVAAEINLNNDHAAALPLVQASDSYLDITKHKG